MSSGTNHPNICEVDLTKLKQLLLCQLDSSTRMTSLEDGIKTHPDCHDKGKMEPPVLREEDTDMFSKDRVYNNYAWYTANVASCLTKR